MPDGATTFAEMWAMLRQALGGGLCLTGALICIAGSIGVIRFPDVYTRLHAASVTDTAGAGLVILGLMLMAPDPVIFTKLVVMSVFFFLTSPAASHAIANAAYSAGIQPRIGRPGAPHDDLEGG